MRQYRHYRHYRRCHRRHPGDRAHRPRGAARRPPPAAHHQSIEVEGVRVFYREAGPANAPAVLLLHGFAASSYMFRNLVPQLAGK